MDNTGYYLLYIMMLPYVVQMYYFLYISARESYIPKVKKFYDKAKFYTGIGFGIAKALSILYWRRFFPPKENVKVLSRSKIEVSYEFRDNTYKFRTSLKRGVSEPILFLDENDNDVSAEIGPYLGPGEDFHSIKYTPHDFGYTKIKVVREGHDPVVFDEYADMELN